VPATRWLTTPASVVVDHLLQEILRDAQVPHIVRDTKSFINELEHTPLPPDGVFLTADVASLYTNIDTPLGLKLVRQFLVKQKVPPARIELIMDLLTFVMSNSYLSFQGQHYKQIDGTAMGTACAPTYANIVVYMLEQPLLDEFGKLIFLYRRFLDDVFVYVAASAATPLMDRLNKLHHKLRFEFSGPHPSEAAFLDLHLYKGARFATRALLDLRVHQKKMNLYLYIPYLSFHPPAMKRAFIQTELMRYIRNSSDQDDYSKLKQIFYQRLRDRGYPHAFLQPLFPNIHYSDRSYFLWPSAELSRHPLLTSQPPRSECLLRRLRRQQQPSPTAVPTTPLVFVLPYSPLATAVQPRPLLLRYWQLLCDAFGYQLPRPILAYQSAPSLLKQLVYLRARRLEERRREASKPAKTQQPQISSLFRRLLPLSPDGHTANAPMRPSHSASTPMCEQQARNTSAAKRLTIA
jgi:hypothetical protein